MSELLQGKRRKNYKLWRVQHEIELGLDFVQETFFQREYFLHLMILYE